MTALTRNELAALITVGERAVAQLAPVAMNDPLTFEIADALTTAIDKLKEEA